MSAIKTVGVIVFRGDQVLLVRHGDKAQQHTGVCGLPSGRVEDETELEAAARELKEESGLEVGKGNLLPIVVPFQAEIPTKNGLQTYDWKVFLALKVTGEFKPPDDETEPFWFDRSRVGELELMPNVERAITLGWKLYLSVQR